MLCFTAFGGSGVLTLRVAVRVGSDLKPDNILCTLSNEDEWELARDSTGRAIVKLTDFGTCKFIGGDERYAQLDRLYTNLADSAHNSDAADSTPYWL